MQRAQRDQLPRGSALTQKCPVGYIFQRYDLDRRPETWVKVELDLRVGECYEQVDRISGRTSMQCRMRTVEHRDPLDVQLGSIQAMKRLLEIQVPRRRDSFGVG